ncbi:leucine-rich repeat and coiled-coil domain-containing protein 1-like [Ptychodera flava]|uniref:leucine-rich repeat and coiled-coil domain-containing protein 1-like n=1 Tax=Ptychodera flava TaxID=63121 RepID=UPI003969F185
MSGKNLRVKLTGMSDDVLALESPHEVVLIDANVNSLLTVPLKGHVQTLNLHCNNISRIENLLHLRSLRHLDLSSNAIGKMEGLEGLVSLKTLNLSCNRISVIEGLTGLVSLTKLNLSYNNIVDLSGLIELHGPDYQLNKLELHGNQISSVNHIVECLIGCIHLSNVTLMHDGSENPICQLPGYRSGLVHSLPQLEVLDGINRSGQEVEKDNGLSDIPGLEDYLDYLMSSAPPSGEPPQENPIHLAFPRIEHALEKFRQRGVGTSTEQTTTTTDQDSSPDVRITAARLPSPRSKGKFPASRKLPADHEIRLEKLEHQLADLMHRRQGGNYEDSMETGSSTDGIKRRSSSEERKHKKYPGKRDIETDESEVEKSKASTEGKGKKLKSVTKGGPQHKKSVHGKTEKVKTAKTKDSSGAQDKVSQRGPSSSSPTSGTEHQFRERVVPTSVEQDADKLALMQELDSERERRWKAEQAARKLVDHIKNYKLKGVAIEATTRLKHALMNEKEAKTKLENKVEELETHLVELTEKYEACQQSEEDQRRALRAMETTAAKAETERIQQQAHEVKKSQEYQMRAAAANREVELLRNMVKRHEDKIQQLQELLAIREQEHRESQQNRYSLDSKEIQDVMIKAVEKEKERHEVDVKLYQERINVLTKQYEDLEDEFRMALQIEANRFREVQEAFERTSQEAATHKQSLVMATEKEKKATNLVTELTAMVKEQKGRLTELSKSKQEALTEAKERLQTVEAHLDEARRRMVQMEMLKQDKSKLQSQITAQESLIEGLRAEKRLWSQELANQGANLAQDRGRLEARIDALTAEVAALKKQEERDQDALRIKSKMIEDQTDTIRNLKEGLVERDSEVRDAREESLKIQKTLEEQLGDEKTANQELQDGIERLTERKEQLKQQVSELQSELDDSRQAHKALDKKWKERAELIGTLETQVKKVKENYESKERTLKEERDKAIADEKTSAERLQSIDNAFRKQLEAAQRSHEDQMEQLHREKQQEIEDANQRVLEVEEEMRQLLVETANSKRAMEEKINRVTKAFTDLQEDLKH